MVTTPKSRGVEQTERAASLLGYLGIAHLVKQHRIAPLEVEAG